MIYISWTSFIWPRKDPGKWPGAWVNNNNDIRLFYLFHTVGKCTSRITLIKMYRKLLVEQSRPFWIIWPDLNLSGLFGPGQEILLQSRMYRQHRATLAALVHWIKFSYNFVDICPQYWHMSTRICRTYISLVCDFSQYFALLYITLICSK